MIYPHLLVINVIFFLPEYGFKATIQRINDANKMAIKGAVHNVWFCTSLWRDFRTGLLMNKDGVLSFVMYVFYQKL
jgi:hypothetical protein